MATMPQMTVTVDTSTLTELLTLRREVRRLRLCLAQSQAVEIATAQRLVTLSTTLTAVLAEVAALARLQADAASGKLFTDEPEGDDA